MHNLDVKTVFCERGAMDHVDKVLAQWARERPDLDTGPMGLIGRLKRLQQVLSESQVRTFAEFGLNAANFDVLATLRRAGPPYALSPSALIEWTMVTSGTMTNRLDRLEAAGLIERRPNPADGRSAVVGLTETGARLIDKAVEAHVATQQNLVAGLSPEERDALNALLKSWLGGLTGQQS